MTIFGLLMMISGIGILFVPVNDSGVINIGTQFLGNTIGISGSVIFVGGFLQDNLVKIATALTQKPEPDVAVVSEPHQIVPERFVLVSEYAEACGVDPAQIFTQIDAGTLKGQTVNGLWYVRPPK